MHLYLYLQLYLYLCVAWLVSIGVCVCLSMMIYRCGLLYTHGHSAALKHLRPKKKTTTTKKSKWGSGYPLHPDSADVAAQLLLWLLQVVVLVVTVCPFERWLHIVGLLATLVAECTVPGSRSGAEKKSSQKNKKIQKKEMFQFPVRIQRFSVMA